MNRLWCERLDHSASYLAKQQAKGLGFDPPHRDT
jgi:hypothetical protein